MSRCRAGAIREGFAVPSSMDPELSLISIPAYVRWHALCPCCCSLHEVPCSCHVWPVLAHSTSVLCAAVHPGHGGLPVAQVQQVRTRDACALPCVPGPGDLHHWPCHHGGARITLPPFTTYLAGQPTCIYAQCATCTCPRKEKDVSVCSPAAALILGNCSASSVNVTATHRVTRGFEACATPSSGRAGSTQHGGSEACGSLAD